ncbi:hypothetical protein HWD35_20670 [Tsukamurella tyrosinosolvens]|uniref:hypothetical protein n=1 Tax=Tsukamurella tyrosinosolvens TaxID=57704 RepID=UPI001CE1A4FD|nr:hypothetical protein [Tsukamurella tyrosinosolvens]MCA4997139.1 hypothetical protein [Tsukamurella tyrosinosolvens]
MEPTTVALRWHKRSIERRYDDEVTEWVPESEDEAGFRFSVAAKYSHAEPNEGDAERPAGTPTLALRLQILIDQDYLSVELDIGIRFSFADDMDMAPEAAAEFATGLGMHYIVGYARGGLTDLTRSVGLAAILLPANLPDEVFDDIRESIFGSA